MADEARQVTRRDRTTAGGRLAIDRPFSYAPRRAMRLGLALLLGAVAASGCQQNIGDSCSASSDCSATGERQCDRAQPGGYCTVFSCDPDTCPQGACVEWRFFPSRTAETWCMETCSNDGACREQYSCVFPANINMKGEWEAEVPLAERIARIIDLDQTSASAKICTALSGSPPPESERDGSETPSLAPNGGVAESF